MILLTIFLGFMTLIFMMVLLPVVLIGIPVFLIVRRYIRKKEGYEW